MGIAYWTIYQARKGKRIPIRHIAGLDALDEAVGRATETGRPVMMIPGYAGISSSKATADTVAGLAVLHHVARKCAELGTKLISATGSYIMIPIIQEQVKQAYEMEGEQDEYQDDIVRYVARGQYAFGAAVMGILARERVAAQILYGYFWSESLVLAEAGASVGAIQVGATSNTTQIPYYVASCDYALIGEEVFAAGAYLSKDQVQLGSLRGGDIYKGIVMILILLTGASLLLGSDAMMNLLAW
ncbi:hypothetical protein KA005_71110 [bacterium]|nr:hypothetical protein [bacterium]